MVHRIFARVQAQAKPLGEDVRIVAGRVSLVENGHVTAVWDGTDSGDPVALGVNPWLPVEPFPAPVLAAPPAAFPQN